MVLAMVAAPCPFTCGADARTLPTTGVADTSVDVSALPVEVRERAGAAAREATARYREWIGIPPMSSVRLMPRPWRGDASGLPDAVLIDIPWWSAAETMDIESHVADGIARWWWTRLPADPDTRVVVDGIAWYLQSRVVENLFDAQYFRAAHSLDGVRVFGGTVAWTFRSLPLSRWTAGLGRAEFLAVSGLHSGWPLSARRVRTDFGSTTARMALMFGTLERYVGWPALQGALRALAARAALKPLSQTELVQTLNDSLGQDVAWLFAEALDPNRRFDYALQGYTSRPVSAPCAMTPCFQTEVTVVRRGSALFTGTSRSPVGPFESGDAMELTVEFSDGHVASARWDGRSLSRTFEFESTTPAAAVRLDPQRVLLLDASYLDDVQRARPVANVPVAKWVAQWLVWLQDAMLTYSF